jgi:hypothetical protein
MKFICILLIALFVTTAAQAKKPTPTTPPPAPKAAMASLDPQSIDIAELRRSVEGLEALKKDLANIKTIRSEVLAQIKFERALAKVNFYTKAEVDELMRKAQKNLKDTCTELYNELSDRITVIEDEIQDIHLTNFWQDKDIKALKADVTDLQDRGMFVQLGLTGGAKPNDGDFYGHINAGVSKNLGSGLLDIQGLIGGTQEGDGFLLGGGVAYLLELNDTLRFGGGVNLHMNFGNSVAELGPHLAFEVGPENFAFMGGWFFPYVVADPNGDMGWNDSSLAVGFNIRL